MLHSLLVERSYVFYSEHQNHFKPTIYVNLNDCFASNYFSRFTLTSHVSKHYITCQYITLHYITLHVSKHAGLGLYLCRKQSIRLCVTETVFTHMYTIQLGEKTESPTVKFSLGSFPCWIIDYFQFIFLSIINNIQGSHYVKSIQPF